MKNINKLNWFNMSIQRNPESTVAGWPLSVSFYTRLTNIVFFECSVRRSRFESRHEKWWIFSMNLFEDGWMKLWTRNMPKIIGNLPMERPLGGDFGVSPSKAVRPIDSSAVLMALCSQVLITSQYGRMTSSRCWLSWRIIRRSPKYGGTPWPTQLFRATQKQIFS